VLRTLALSGVAALVIAVDWLRFEDPRSGGGRPFALAALAIVPALVRPWWARLCAVCAAAFFALCIAFSVAPVSKNYNVFDVSARLREQGWLVPAYTFPENRQDLAVLRVVVRAGMSHDMADLFLEGLRKQTGWLESLSGPLPQRPPEDAAAFKH